MSVSPVRTLMPGMALWCSVLSFYRLEQAPNTVIGQRYARLRLKEMGELAGGFEYPAINAAIARFEKRLKD
jgi:hypothetical protein